MGTAVRRGSLLIDVLLAVVIFGAIIATFSSGILQGQQGNIRGGHRIRAAYLAREGLEAIRAIRDRDSFTGSIALRALNDDDGVDLIGSGWTIVSAATTIDDFYVRAVRFLAGEDENSREVRVTVTWDDPGSSKSGSLTVGTYLTNWQAGPPPPPPDWSDPDYVGSVTDVALDDSVLEKVEVKSGYAFAAVSTSFGLTRGLAVFDVQNTGSPTYVGTTDVNGSAYDVAVHPGANYVYLATDDTMGGELKVLDISTPTSVSCSPCTRTINLGGVLLEGIAISGTGLYVVRGISGNPELYVFDIQDDPTLMNVSNPPALINPSVEAIYESDADGARSMYAATATGAPLKPYAYLATNHITQELTVVSVTGATVTGSAHTQGGSGQKGNAIVVFNTGAYIGVEGDSACEVFSFEIETVPFPETGSACGGDQAYDVGGDSDNGGTNDFATGRSIAHLFIAADGTIGATEYYLHILNIATVHDINSAAKRIYTGGDADVTGHNIENGVFYRESDHLLFMVGGGEAEPSELVIFKPQFGY